MANPAFHRSDLTDQIVTAILQFNAETITYVDLSIRIGQPVDGASSALRSARRIIEREHRIVYETVIGVGLRRLDDGQKVRSTARHVRAINRSANNGKRRLKSADYNTLNNEDQLLHTIRNTQFAEIKKAVSNKAAQEAVPAVKDSDIKAALAKLVKP